MKLRDATLVFLIKRDLDEISEICLGMKKKGFGKGRWNGIGGKVGDKMQESVEEAAVRETQEEIGVDVKDLEKVAELTFTFPHNSAWDQVVHVYLAESWQGDPQESDEMSPRWFLVQNIPFKDMWLDDIFWLPKVLEGAKVRAAFTFGEGDSILSQKVEEVNL